MNLSPEEQKALGHVFSNPVSDFVDGQRDCRDGSPARSNASKDYDRGYGFQCEIEQRLTSGEYS